VSKRVVYLTDEQWKKIEPLIPKPPPRPKGGPPRANDRLVFEGILWILKTGARWKDLPDKYLHPSTCWRRLKEWYEAEVLKDMWRAFLSGLDANGVLDWEESFIDASFFPAKKGSSGRKDQKGKGNKVYGGGRWQRSSTGKPYHSASPAEVRLAEKTLQQIKVPEKGPGRPRTRPKRVIGDKAYDSDPLRKKLRKRGINLLSPHRRNHRNVNRQDDRLWDRYMRRYIVERTFSWITNYPRIVVRYEKSYQSIGRFLPTGLCHDNIEKIFMRFCNRLLTHKSEES
jgi:transposase